MYYCEIDNGKILNYTTDSQIAEMNGWLATIDYEPLRWLGDCFTLEKFREIQSTQEYKDEIAQENKTSYDIESKKFENEASYIQYKGKKISLEEILFKSLIYTSITDAYVYLKTEDGTLIKTLKATFLLIVAKAKLNLKLVEDALYDADNQFDPKKTLEENIAKIKGIFDNIDKVFND